MVYEIWEKYILAFPRFSMTMTVTEVQCISNNNEVITVFGTINTQRLSFCVAKPINCPSKCSRVTQRSAHQTLYSK